MPRRPTFRPAPAPSPRTPVLVPVLLAVFLGGALGAWARYRLSVWIDACAGRAFPWGTLAVNVAGSFALGLLLPGLAGESPALRAFAAAGFLGAFTTFSTFAAETLALARDGLRWRAATYVALSLGLGLVAVAGGMWIGGGIG